MHFVNKLAVVMLLVSSAWCRTVTATFSATENPVSQSATWINGGAIGLDWHNCRATSGSPGYAFGTQPGTTNFDDSACLSGGPWGMSQTVSITVHVVSHAQAAFEEAEVRGRSTLAAHSSTGYELNCSLIPTNPYMQIVRWDGALGGFTELNAAATSCAEGDVLKMTVTGSGASTVITGFKNNVQQVSWADTGCTASWCSLPGQPGMGFYIQNVSGTAAAANAEFGATSFTATDGNASLLTDGIIDSQRVVDWTAVGSPAYAASATWTQCGTTVPAGSSVTTINNAIAACPANHFVQLAAGIFNLTGTVNFAQKSNVKVVGAGADKTFLIFSSVGSCLGFTAAVTMCSADLNYVFNQSNIANWTAGYAAGTTSITVSSKTNLAVGTAMLLDQGDDTVDSGNVFVCYLSNGTLNCSTNGDNGGFARANRGQQQIVTVTSIPGTACPCVIGITPGIYMPNWSSGKTPQAWWATSPVSNMGIENLSINMAAAEPTVGNGTGVAMLNCSGCWVRGIRSIQPGRSHVQIQVSTNVVVRDSYFYRTAGQTSTSYGIETGGASSVLMQNNIFQQVTEPMALNGSCSGCVEGYNYDTDNIFDSGGGLFSWRMASSLPHAVGVSHVLIEGNQGSGLQGDIIHGSHHFITAYRNAWNGFQKNNGVNTTQNTNPIILNALNRFYNIVGNVLGSTALPHTNYQTGNAASIYLVGVSESGANTVPADSNVGRTLMRWANYDVVTAGVRLCGASFDTGFSTTCSSTSEVPASITGGFPTGVPIFGDTTLGQAAMPASFYLTSKPTWWPSTKAWPPIGPDVSGGNLANLAGHAYSIPAADCYAAMGGPADGTGSVLTFNPDNCSATAPPPSPPFAPGSGLLIAGSNSNAGGVSTR